MIEKYQIASHLIMRENDAALFDSSTFQIMKFNPTGFNLLLYLQKKECSFDEYREFANAQGISEEDFSSFFKKCLNQGIILLSKE